ncbi:ribonuclease HI family protein [Chloroflexota bacterium]
MPIKKLLIFTDGGAEPNPGKAGIGVVIKSERGEVIASISQSIGHATNNQAEYSAIIAALEKAIQLGAEQVSIRSDSELVVKQLNGRYRVKNIELKPLYLKVKQLQKKLKSFDMVHIPREKNREADKLASKAIR